VWHDAAFEEHGVAPVAMVSADAFADAEDAVAGARRVSTIRRILQLVDLKALDTVSSAWLAARLPHPAAGRTPAGEPAGVDLSGRRGGRQERSRTQSSVIPAR
jgi:hypothetical protein